MKHLLVLLGAAFGLTTATLSAQTANDSPRPSSMPTGAAKTRQDAAIARAIKNHRCIFFITNYTVTGSHIPVVVTHYEGLNYTSNSFTPSRIYSSGAIGLSGSLNVGSALSALDPAITIR